MAIDDIVVDTNVLMHASNPQEPRFDAAKNFLERFVQVHTCLCVDEGFDIDESRNRSLIGGEYLDRLSPGTIGYAVISMLALDGRLSMVPTRVADPVRRKINQMIGNSRDRTFVRVAVNSGGRVLVSHDYSDFPVPIRNKINLELGVLVEDASDATTLIK